MAINLYYSVISTVRIIARYSEIRTRAADHRSWDQHINNELRLLAPNQRNHRIQNDLIKGSVKNPFGCSVRTPAKPFGVSKKWLRT